MRKEELRPRKGREREREVTERKREKVSYGKKEGEVIEMLWMPSILDAVLSAGQASRAS